MNKYNPILVLSLVFSLLVACKEEEQDPGQWSGAGPLSGYTVTPINGGATITYATPDDPDLLYIMAEYQRNGQTFNEKSSIYNNTLTIEGFNTTSPVKAALYKVNKKGQRSDPLNIQFTPLESVISIATRTMDLKTSFGGIIASWENPLCTELGIRLMVKDSVEGMETKEMYYSETEKETHSFRGFENKETTFGISIEDKWGNISDTIYYKTTPYFEALIPKPYADFRSYIPYDNTTNLDQSWMSFDFSKLWDNVANYQYNGWITSPWSSGRSFTIDLQRVAKLSRIITWGYHVGYIFGQVGITAYELWGTDKIDQEKLSDPAYWMDEAIVRDGGITGLDPATPMPSRTFKDDWHLLGDFAFPEEMQSYSAAEIAAVSATGVEFEIDPDAVPVRYVRFLVRRIDFYDDFPANNYFTMGEVSFFGDYTVPQE